MCACAERRAAMLAGARSLMRGDVAGAAAEARFVASSSLIDAAALARQARAGIAASHMRLKRR